MDRTHAARLINNVQYKPGWTIASEAVPSNENALYVRVTFAAPDATYPPESQVMTTVRAYGVLDGIDAIGSDLDLHRKVLNHLIEVETHEAREFYRAGPDREMLFNPHSRDGEMSWQITKLDHRHGLPGFPEFERAFVK